MRNALRDDLTREPVFWWALVVMVGVGLTLTLIAFAAVLLASVVTGVQPW